MKSDPTKDRDRAKTHQHYVEWFRGDGAKTEFRLQHHYTRFDDVEVFLNGFLFKPDVSGATEDYKLRGLTPGYAGEKNAVKFASAPANLWDIAVRLVST